MKKVKLCAYSSSGACTPICMCFNSCKRNPWKSGEKEKQEKPKKQK